MGRVWAAHDEVLERDVAVKEVLLPPAVSAAEREALVARTLREGRAAARVRHPRVVAVYDVVEDDERPWLVLQLLEPRTLADVLAAEGTVDPARAALIGLQVLDGLTAVHAAGVLHRDVKPANVLFGPDGGAVLADFGVAALEDDAAVTSTGLVLGSPAYLAPERARGDAPTPAADLWSLGATLFAAVEGRSPFHREGPLPTLGALLTQDVPAAPGAGALAPAIAALLTKNPAERPDAATVRLLLLQALNGYAAAAGDRTAAVPVVDGVTAAMALPVAPAVAVMPVAATAPVAPTVPVEPTEPVTPAVPVAATVPGITTVVPQPRRRRRALVALAAVALLSGPVAALAQRHGPVLAEVPASAGTALFSTTPKVATRTPAASPSTTARKAASAPAAKRGVAPAVGSASAQLSATSADGQGSQTQSRQAANVSASRARGATDEKADDKGKGDDEGKGGGKGKRDGGDKSDGDKSDGDKGKDKGGDDGGNGDGGHKGHGDDDGGIEG